MNRCTKNICAGRNLSKEDEVNAIMISTDALVLQHLRKTWEFNAFGESPCTSSLLKGIISSLTIIRFDPLVAEKGVWAYVTSGARVVRCESSRKEFLILSPRSDERHLQTLEEVVFRHAVPNNALFMGETFTLSRPWLEGSLCDCLLVSRPYLLSPSLEFLDLDEYQVQFCWLFPITSQERGYLHKNGLDVLERLFEQQRVKPLDPTRPSVV
jgi:hypothetical protein